MRGFAAAGGHAPQRVWRLSRRETALFVRYRLLRTRKDGVRVGLDPAMMGRLHADGMTVDTEAAVQALGITHADLDQAIRDTARD